MTDEVFLVPLLSRTITLIGADDDVAINEFSASQRLGLPKGIHGEVIGLTLVSSGGGILEVNGQLWFFSADPELSAGDADLDAAAKWLTCLGKIDVATDYWSSNTTGKVWERPVSKSFGVVDDLWVAWQMDGSSQLNSAGGDDEVLQATIVVRQG